MEPFDQRIKQQFQKEADDLLFSQLEFDNRLKDKVRQQLISDKSEQVRPLQRISGWKQWLALGSVAAAILGAVVIQGLFNSDSMDPSTIAEGIDQNIERTHDDPIEEGFNPLAAPPIESDSIDLPTPLIATAQEMTIEEASKLFGEPLRLPAYLPEGYELTKTLTFDQPGDALKVELLYTSADGYFQLTESKSSFGQHEYDGEIVMIQGYEGVINRIEQADSAEPYLFLEWQAEGVHYSLSGTLPEQELVMIAKSMFENP